MKQQNKYQLARQRRQLTGIGEHPKKPTVKDAAMETGTDLAITTVAGGLLGFFTGPWGMLAGLAGTAFGNYTNIPMIRRLGVGVMTSSAVKCATETFINSKPAPAVVNGLEGQEIDGFADMKPRFNAFLSALKQGVFLTKKPKPASAPVAAKPAAVNGLGDVLYFRYPENLSGDMNEVNGPEENLSALDDIEAQLAASAEEFAGTAEGEAALSMAGMEENFETDLHRLYGTDSELSGEEVAINGAVEEISGIEEMIL